MVTIFQCRHNDKSFFQMLYNDVSKTDDLQYIEKIHSLPSITAQHPLPQPATFFSTRSIFPHFPAKKTAALPLLFSLLLSEIYEVTQFGMTDAEGEWGEQSANPDNSFIYFVLMDFN